MHTGVWFEMAVEKESKLVGCHVAWRLNLWRGSTFHVARSPTTLRTAIHNSQLHIQLAILSHTTRYTRIQWSLYHYLTGGSQSWATSPTSFLLNTKTRLLFLGCTLFVLRYHYHETRICRSSPTFYALLCFMSPLETLNSNQSDFYAPTLGRNGIEFPRMT